MNDDNVTFAHRDQKRLARMCSLHFLFEGRCETGGSPLNRVYDSICNDKKTNWKIVVAYTQDKQPIGVIALNRSPSPPWKRFEVQIFVDPRKRGAKVGSRLIEEMERFVSIERAQWAANQGLNRPLSRRFWARNSVYVTSPNKGFLHLNVGEEEVVLKGGVAGRRLIAKRLRLQYERSLRTQRAYWWKLRQP